MAWGEKSQQELHNKYIARKHCLHISVKSGFYCWWRVLLISREWEFRSDRLVLSQEKFTKKFCQGYCGRNWWQVHWCHLNYVEVQVCANILTPSKSKDPRNCRRPLRFQDVNRSAAFPLPLPRQYLKWVTGIFLSSAADRQTKPVCPSSHCKHLKCSVKIYYLWLLKHIFPLNPVVYKDLFKQ